jgi:hypothetical protein
MHLVITSFASPLSPTGFGAISGVGDELNSSPAIFLDLKSHFLNFEEGSIYSTSIRELPFVQATGLLTYCVQ